jgi:26S proteasome regulatory subunit N11
MNLHKKGWTEGLKLTDFEKHKEGNEESVKVCLLMSHAIGNEIDRSHPI